MWQKIQTPEKIKNTGHENRSGVTSECEPVKGTGADATTQGATIEGTGAEPLGSHTHTHIEQSQTPTQIDNWEPSDREGAITNTQTYILSQINPRESLVREGVNATSGKTVKEATLTTAQQLGGQSVQGDQDGNSDNSVHLGQIQNSITGTTGMEELQAELKRLQEQNAQLQSKAEEMELRHKIEQEKRSQVELETKLRTAAKNNEDEQRAHEKRIEDIGQLRKELEDTTVDPAVWLRQKLQQLTGEVVPQEDKHQAQRQKLEQLLEQQKKLANQAKDIVGEEADMPQDIMVLLQALGANSQPPKETLDEQQVLMQQLQAALSRDNKNTAPQRELMKQFLVDSSKTEAAGGVNTLKPDLLKRMLGESDQFNMAEWLARYNVQDIGESFSDIQGDVEGGSKKQKSGMLDKAGTSIHRKVIWAQKNLMEDWADEDVDFKQINFDHLVAGEMRTIEMCTEPAEILARIRLIRKMAYARLRGYDWVLIRKLYAAVLRAIESKECDWEANFDRFDAILYRRPPMKPRQPEREDRGTQGKKWFCRDWNKPEGCTRSAPHKAWVGSGQNASQKTVLHICAACYMKERAAREHPECSDNCPHKAA